LKSNVPQLSHRNNQLSALKTFYLDKKIYIGNTVTDNNSRITSIQSRIYNIKVSHDYINAIVTINDTITSLQYHVNGIVLHRDNIYQINNLNSKVIAHVERITTISKANLAVLVLIMEYQWSPI
jgi:hypothetical protein